MLHEIDFDLLEKRSTQTLSASPRPFVKWAGSKRSLISQFIQVLPRRFRTYREPFLGSGSLFFLLRPRRAVLSDICSELIQTYKAVRDDPHAVLQHLGHLKPEKKLYYVIRENRSSETFQRAAEFLFLNKCCWNGLYRVNASGKFNVPFGRPRSETLVDAENLLACANALSSEAIQIMEGDFDGNLAEAEEGDLVYLDPPYVTSHNNNGFIDYNEVLFRWADQVRLAERARELSTRGVHVIVSNADHEPVVALYPGFRRLTVERVSTLASDKARRRRVSEVVLISPSLS